MKQNYEYIINHEPFVVVMDCDSTVIGSKKGETGEVLTTGEGLTDAAFALGKRLSNDNIASEIDEIAQEAMSKRGAIFEDSLNARFSIFTKYGLTKKDVLSGAEEAILSEGFDDYIKLKDWLKEEQALDYEHFFFLSGGFREMLETVLLDSIGEKRVKELIFSNEFKYDDKGLVTGWDKEKSLMYSPSAKKDMVEELRKTKRILENYKVSGLGDGSNDISMSDEKLFVAYTGVRRREQVIEKANGVEAKDFYEVAVFHTSPEERKLILEIAPETIKNILIKGIKSLKSRIDGLEIK